MKIIKTGKLYANKTAIMVGHCNSCGTEFECYKYETFCDVDIDQRYTFCPLEGCHMLVYVTKKTVRPPAPKPGVA